MAFPPNSQMSALDLSALAGVTPEQLAIIARAMQSGALPFPPPPPPPASSLPAHSLSSSQVTGLVAPAQPISGQHQTTKYQNGLVGEDIDMGSEEGEVDEDVDTMERSGPPEFLHPPPTGPRNRSTTPRNRVSRAEARRLASQANNNTSNPRVRPAANTVSASAHTLDDGKRGMHAQSQNVKSIRNSSLSSFLKAMLDAGYSHDQLATQVSNPEAFRKLALTLGLPARSTSQVASVPTDTSQVVAQQINVPKAAVAAAAPKKPPPPKTGAPKDRSEYLAKLQAAKNKKSELPANPVKPTAQTTKSPVTIPPAQQSSATTAANAKAAKDELLRKRLEAIMAAKAKKSALASSEQFAGKQSTMTQIEPSSVPGAASLESLSNLDYRTPYDSDGPLQNVAVPSFVVASSATSHLKSSAVAPSSPQSKLVTPELESNAPPTFNGLPGLFMTGASSRPPSAPEIQPLAPTPPAAQTPVVIDLLTSSGAENSDTNVTVAKSGLPQLTKPATPQNRPFGRTRYIDEPLIIRISDDEDDDDDAMDISDSDEESDSRPLNDRKSSSDGKVVPSTGERPQLQRSQMSSSAATPSATTPSQDAYNKKLQQIELLKRQLAEREQRKRTKSNGLADGSTSVSATSGAATPTNLPTAPIKTAENTAVLSPPAVNQVAGNIKPATLVTGEVSNIDLVKQDREYWQRRHDELKQQLRSNGAALPQLQGLAQVSAESDDRTSSPSAVDAATHIPSSTAGDATALAEPTSINGHEQRSNEVPGSIEDVASNLDSAETILPEAQPAEASSKAEDEDDDLDDIYDQAQPSLAPVTKSDTTMAEHPVSTEAGQATQERPDDDDGAVNADESTDDDDDAMDTSDDPSTDSDDSASDDYEPELVADPLIPTASPLGDQQPAREESRSPNTNGDPTADNAVFEHNATKAPSKALLSRKQDSAKDQEFPSQPEHFTPYESPLTRFKDFRYHRDFLSAVPGGYKSLTYSNQIDPMKELCPFEAGGVCNDPNCQYQHFRDMALSDNILLRALSTDHPPTKTPEDEQRWKAGLTELIKELKTTNLGKQDVGLIAQRIAQYRRDFIADPTVTLRLE